MAGVIDFKDVFDDLGVDPDAAIMEEVRKIISSSIPKAEVSLTGTEITVQDSGIAKLPVSFKETIDRYSRGELPDELWGKISDLIAREVSK